MRRALVAATLLAGCLAPAARSTAGDLGAPGQRPTSPAAGYACISSPRAPQTKVVLGAPPAGFTCPKGQQLFIVTRQLQDKVAAAPATEIDVPGQAGPPGVSPLPGSQEQEVRAKKRRISRKCTSDGTGGQYCCYGGTSNCQLE
ncbi:MAG TPA: hypothetical protein PLB01_06925 [Thermoanaerobaculia bacterium]|nr:hypothetical protein [Thermoanaerobaculia bacterium]